VSAYTARILVSAGHFSGAKPADWTEVTVSHTVQADDRAGAYAAIIAYAREEFNLGPLIDHEDTRTYIDASLID
jgi:hypothetical protein